MHQRDTKFTQREREREREREQGLEKRKPKRAIGDAQVMQGKNVTWVSRVERRDLAKYS